MDGFDQIFSIHYQELLQFEVLETDANLSS